MLSKFDIKMQIFTDNQKNITCFHKLKKLFVTSKINLIERLKHFSLSKSYHRID